MSFVLGLDGIQEFEASIRKICDYAFAHATKAFKSFNPETATAEEYKAFLAKCHEGFALAQDIIVDQLLKIQMDIRDCSIELKESRLKKNREAMYQCKAKSSSLTHRVLILRKVADAIAWQLWGMQRWNLRRLFLGKQMPYLDSSNIASIMSEVKEINKDPLSFGLITDITSFIQVGDILKVDRSSTTPRIDLIEMKEGVMNEMVMEFLETIGKIRCPRIPYFFAQEHGMKALKQAKRVVKQHIRAAQVQQFVKTGKGKDLLLDQEIIMPDEIFMEKDYDETLVELIESCKSNGRAFDIVDDCLFIGVYDPAKCPAYLSDFINNLYLEISGTAIVKQPFERSEEIHMKETYEFSQKAYPIYDIRQSLSTPLSRPIFLRWLPNDVTLNIIFGRIIVLLYLDYDSWFTMSKNHEMIVRWSTGKEFKKLMNDKTIFKVRDKIPIFEKKGASFQMGDGILSRIIDGTRPDSILAMLSQSLDYFYTMKSGS